MMVISSMPRMLLGTVSASLLSSWFPVVVFKKTAYGDDISNYGKEKANSLGLNHRIWKGN